MGVGPAKAGAQVLFLHLKLCPVSWHDWIPARAAITVASKGMLAVILSGNFIRIM
jgi:hypothetical protein